MIDNLFLIKINGENSFLDYLKKQGLAREINPGLIKHEDINIEPLNAPLGEIFCIRSNYK